MHLHIGRYTWVFIFKDADTAKLTGPRSSTDEKVGGPVKNMGGPIKLLYVIMFNILKSCQKWIFGPVKHEKFSRCLKMISLHHMRCFIAIEYFEYFLLIQT